MARTRSKPKSKTESTRSRAEGQTEARAEETSFVAPAGRGVAAAKAERVARGPSRRRAPGNAQPGGLRAGVARLRPVLLLAGVLASVYAVVALATYDPLDPSWSRASGSTVGNAAGPLGAWLADLLYQVLGYGAWLVVPVGVALALRLARRSVGGVGRALAAGLLSIGALCVVALVAPAAPGADFPPGGLLGEVVVGNLAALVGPAGTWIVVVGLILACLPFVVPIQLEDLAARLVGGVEVGAPQVGRAGLRLGRKAVGGVAAASAAVAGRVRDARADTRDAGEEEDEDDSYWEDASGGPWQVDDAGHDPRSAVDLRAAAQAAQPRPAADPLARLPEVEAPATAWRDQAPARPAAGLAAADAREQTATPAPRTMASGRALVEAVWEPTLPPADDDVRDTVPAAALAAQGEPLDLAAFAARSTARAAASPAAASPAAASPAAASPAAVAAASPAAVRPTAAASPAAVRPTAAASPAAAARPTAGSAIRGAAPPPPSLADEDYGTGLDLSSSALDAPEPASLPGLAPVAAAGSTRPATSRGAPPSADRAPPPDDTDDDSSDPLPGFVPRRAVSVAPGALVSGGNHDVDLIADVVDHSFELPHMGLLDMHERDEARFDEAELQQLAQVLEEKFGDFGVKGEVVAIRPGPVVTTFEYLPAPGIKLSKISALSDDIAMALKAVRVRIVAPIPGKGVVGIEIPNKKRQTVWLRDMLSSDSFRKNRGSLPMALGKTVEGKAYIGDLAKMPHLLVGGTTGSGKSVGVNAMLLSMLYVRTPQELRLILIDPKMLEFELYRDIPHLLHPVVTEPKLASAALRWACTEMDERYRTLSRWGVRNISSYNKKVEQELEHWTPEKAWRYAPADHPSSEPPPLPKMMPYIVIVIDELADLMMVAAKDVEESIIRLAQKARAAGIHLIVATQRPSVNVITGLIKANMPSRIAFQVRTKVDGRTILDQNGAENLLGKGDQLFLPPGVSALERIHGPFVADEEVGRVCDFLRAQGTPTYEAQIVADDEAGEEPLDDGELDDLYDLAVAYVCRQGKASASMIQREFRIGYNRAARILEIMEREGVVGPADGARPREVLVRSHAS